MMAARKRANQNRIGNERKKKLFKRYYSEKVFWNFIDKAVVHIC